MGSFVRVFGVFAFSVAGCTALSGLDDLGSESADGNGASTTTPEAGTVVTLPDGAVVTIGDDGGIIELPPPPPPLDGSILLDSGIDAPVTRGYCASLATTPTLCTDFDDAVFPGPWTPRVAGTGGAFALDSTLGRSGARSTRFTVVNGGLGAAYLSKTFPQMATTTVKVGFSVRPTAVVTNGSEFELMTILLGTAIPGAPDAYEIQLERVNGMLTLEEETPQQDGAVPEKNTALGIASPLNQWMRIDVTVSLAAGSSSVTITAEGSATQVFATSAHLYNTVPPRVFIGYDSATTSTLDIRYDDIIVDIK